MRPAATTRQQQRRAPLAAAALASLAAACVTTYEPVEPEQGAEGAPLAVPVSIPLPEFGGGDSRVLLEFYGGILRRLQDAADDGDVELLDSLVESYDRPSVPDAFRQHLDGYRAIARGIAFQQHVQASAELRLVSAAGPGTAEPGKAPPLGEPLQLELELPPPPAPVRLGALGDRDPIGFSVAVTVDDEYLDGSSRESQSKEFLWLPRAFAFESGESLLLPIEVGAAVGDAVRRTVLVRVDLMPGYADCDGMRAPLQRVTAGAVSTTQWPKGHEILAAQPLAGLKAALADFNPRNFASAYLSALLVPARDRREATALLMDQVRFGRADQARVAMAALHKTAGVQIAVGDRDAWLAWWQSRQ